MARKNIVSAFPMITAEDMSSTITSEPTDVKNLDQATIRVTWDLGGTPVGELTIEALQEKDDDASALDDSNWFTLDFGDTINIDAVSNPGESEHQIIFTQLPFNKIRLKYTPDSGSGTLNAKITAKQLGG